jgi:hypothetical protein
MAKIIKLTQDNSRQEYFVNADHIIQFWKDDQADYTNVVFSSSQHGLTVGETPDEISKKISAA